MSTPTATAEPGRAPGGADPRRWVALAVVLAAGFMQLVDISIVNVAIPSIQRDLDATYAQIQWVLAGYQLAFAVMLITGGRLGDIFGRKRLFMAGMAGFTVASALCGLAQSPEMLIGSRAVQGVDQRPLGFRLGRRRGVHGRLDSAHRTHGDLRPRPGVIYRRPLAAR